MGCLFAKKNRNEQYSIEQNKTLGDSKDSQKRIVSKKNLVDVSDVSIQPDAQSKKAFIKRSRSVKEKTISPQRRKSRILTSRTALGAKIEPRLEIFLSEKVDIKRGRFSQDYTIVSNIGKGGYGQVFTAQHNITRMVRAVKILKRNRNPYVQEALNNELVTLQSLDHPNVVKVFDIYEDDRFLYFVQEYCVGGDLLDQVRKNFNKGKQVGVNEIDIAIAIKQVLSGINALHQKNIIHRNIRPENILSSTAKPNSDLKLINFGLSMKFTSADLKLGTMTYQSPESVKGSALEEPCDIWSCGVMIHFLLTGRFPFVGKDEKSLKRDILRGMPQIDQQNLSLEATELIKSMLQFSPKDRPTAHQCLQSPWFSKVRRRNNLQLSKDALDSMTQFQSKAKIQTMLLSYIINLLATQEEMERLSKIFQELDKNQDGKLNRQELLEGYQRLPGYAKEAEQQVARIFATIDTNFNGDIDYSEFIMACINKENLLQEKNLNKAFQTLDRDKSGLISLKEIKSQFSESLDNNTWNVLIRELDQDSNGLISKKEFFRCMRQLINEKV